MIYLFSDKRSRKIALVANCIINQNSKVDKYALYPAMVPGFVDLLEKFGFGIEQMPCPEMYTAGIRRWWQVSEQYSTSGYIRSFTFLANIVLDLIEDYIRSNFKVILIGVDGSPTCGVNYTDTDQKNQWMGSPTIKFKKEEDYIKKGEAPFIKVLKKQIYLRDLPEMPMIGLPMDTPGGKINLKLIEKFLSKI